MRSTSSLECPKCGHTPCDVIEEKDVWHSHREIWLKCSQCKHIFRLEIPWERIKSGNLRIGRLQGRTVRDILAQ